MTNVATAKPVMTRANLEAIKGTFEFEGTIEELAAEKGWDIAETTPEEDAKLAKRAMKGKSNVIIMYSEKLKHVMFTANVNFAGAGFDWILNDWKKTVSNTGSRQQLVPLVYSGDLEMIITDPQPAVTGADKDLLHARLAKELAPFIRDGYEVKRRWDHDLRNLVDAEIKLLVAADEEKAEEVKQEKSAKPENKKSGKKADKA